MEGAFDYLMGRSRGDLSEEAGSYGNTKSAETWCEGKTKWKEEMREYRNFTTFSYSQYLCG